MSDDPSELRRFLHWGPMLALALTATIILMTWVWWPKNLSYTTCAHFGLFLLLNLLATYNYVMAVLVGPGLLPRHWQPQQQKDAKFLQFCTKCQGYKAPRSHHCQRCNRCVKKMDHHCPWINHCVGWSNQAYFVHFLFFYMLSNLHASVVLSLGGFHYFLDTFEAGNIKSINLMGMLMCFSSFAASLAIVLCMIKLLYIQMFSILKNMTSIEKWIVEKARYRRHNSKRLLKPFLYPYNIGWYSNLGQVFNLESQTRGCGIEWPVRMGCDQYTLTREQLAQKAEKRQRTRIFKCIRHATGHWFPILSQGLMVTIQIPCVDDHRIRLEPNDIIRVTRIRDYWLFGERVLQELEADGQEVRKGPIRGWFPRRCAIDITGSELLPSVPDAKEVCIGGKHKLNQD